VSNNVNPLTLVILHPFNITLLSDDEFCILKVVPVSPSTVGLLIETDIGEPSCSDETALFTSTIPADVPRKSIEVIYCDVVRSNTEPFSPVHPFNEIDVREVILLTSN